MYSNVRKNGIIYSIAHFLVEIGCFYWVFSRAYGVDTAVILSLAYDSFVFLPQIYIGAFFDRFPRIFIGPIGFLLIIAALFDPETVSSLIFLTVGNCFLHVEGAEMTLRGAEGKMAPSGIFVAGGAFGVITGRLLALFCPSIGFWIAVFAAVTGAIITFFARKLYPCEKNMSKNGKYCGFCCDNVKMSTGLVLLLSFFTVAARSYVAYTVPNEWMIKTWQVILQYIFMGVGKGLGGILADKFGARKVGTLSLLFSIPFLCLGRKLMFVSLFGIMLFSMTMAISLGVLVSRLDSNPGIAFGITTTGLFIGIIPAFFAVPVSYPVQVIMLTTLSLFAAGCFYLCAGNENVKLNK